MTNILEDIRKYIYCICNECSDEHDMTYINMTYIGNKEYMCEKCHRIVNINSPEFENQELNVNWKGLKTYILKSLTPKKVIKMFIVKFMKREYLEYQIQPILEELKITGIINFSYLETIKSITS